MPVIFGPAGACATLSGSRVMTNSGTTTITIQPTQPGIYENCTLAVRDRGNNLSNSIALPILAYNA